MTASATSATMHSSDTDVFNLAIREPCFTVIHAGPKPDESPALAGRKCSEREMSDLRTAAWNIAQSSFNEFGTLYPIRTTGFLIFALGFKPSQDYEDEALTIKALLDRCIEESWQSLGLKLYICTSCIEDRQSSVLRAYREAQSIAVHFPFLNTSVQTLSGYDVKTAPPPSAVAARKELEESWFLASARGDFASAKRYILSIIDYRSSSPRTVITLKDELVARLSYFSYTFCDERNLDNSYLIYLLCITDRLMGANNLKNLKDLIESYYAAVVVLASSVIATEPDSSVSRIAAYIRENYQDPALNASVLSRKFGLNPSYISYAFHCETGIKLVDFLHTIRINHIKSALTDTDQTMERIAQESGYYTRAAMTRVFTRYMGINPSEYRRRYT